MKPLTQSHKRFRAEATVIDNEASGHADTEPDGRMQWVNCEACGGTGEIIKGPPGEPYNEYVVLCPVCEGHGIDCEPR